MTSDLLLNAAKTYHVSHTKFGITPFATTYFIESTKIIRKDNVFDLGVHFDDNLTFKLHRKYIYDRIRTQTGAAIRFAKGIKHRKILSRILRINIAPVTEYAAPV